MITAAEPTETRVVQRSRTALHTGLVLLATLVLFWPTVWSFTVTWGRYDYSHGWLVPFLLGWLIWSAREDFRHPRRGDGILLLAIAALSVFWLLSVITHIMLFHQTALVLMLVGWGLYVFGRPAARTVVMSGVVVLLSLPLWEWSIPVLQRLTTLASGAMASAVRIPLEIEGDLIHLQSGSFEIAHGCAGLNYLLSAVLIALVYAQVLLKDNRSRLAVVAAAAAIAIVGNWIRVAALVVIGHVTEMQAWLIPNHIEFGWGIFALGLLLFFGVARWIEGRAPRKARAARKAEAGAGEGVARDESTGTEASAGPESAPSPEPSPTPVAASPLRRMVLASGLAVLGPVLYLGFGALPPAQGNHPGFPDVAATDGWRVAESAERPFDWHPAYRGAQQHEVIAFTNGHKTVYGDRFVYREQAQGAKLIGWPNAMGPYRTVLDQRAVGPVDPQGRRWVRQALIRTDEGPILTWYWYRVGGVETFTNVHAKVLEIPAFLTRRRVSELIAISAPCGPEDCAGAVQALAGFMGTRIPAAPSTAGEDREATDPGAGTVEEPEAGSPPADLDS
jgi:EpsI family protein